MWFAGYGFVDFETAHAADLAVKALQANGIQAQMAKVRVSYAISSRRLVYFLVKHTCSRSMERNYPMIYLSA